MKKLSRREFLEYGTKLAVIAGLSTQAVPKIAAALEKISSGQAPVLWLQGQSCSGCSVSLLNSESPGPAEILTETISLLFHATLSVATGTVGMEQIERSIESGGYILVIEGSIPVGMPESCEIGQTTFPDLVIKAAQKAKAVVAVGTCATYGGIPAAENNPTGAVGTADFFKQENIKLPLILLPGCPTHPDWVVGTLVHVLEFGIPPLDSSGCPKMFYSKLVHDQCTRFADYERERFAKSFTDEGCLFKLGCLGPITYADCTVRHWNAATNSCIKAGAPCIGCSSKQFPGAVDFSFYRKSGKNAKEEGPK